MRIETDELDIFQKRLIEKQYKFSLPGIQEMPWGSRDMSITDPFRNRLTFTSAISTSAHHPHLSDFMQKHQGARVSVRRRASQASIGLAVAGLHLAGLLMWWTAEHGMQLVRNDKTIASIAVWLPSLPPLETHQAKPTSRQQQQQQQQQPAPDPSGLRTQRDSSLAEPNHAMDATAAPTSDGLPMSTEALQSATSPTETPGTPALNLNLSRKAITSVAPPSFAEQSPFRDRLPATVERQIASAAAETGPWAEERIDNDHIRFRRGNTCVTMDRPRAATIDPFSEAMARIPWRASLSENCQ